MPPITESHVTDSIADALQYVACYHPVDFIAAMGEAFRREENPGARNAIGQILTNSRMCALGRRPICQDTGAANVFVKVGVQAVTDWTRPLQEIVDDAVQMMSRLVDDVMGDATESISPPTLPILAVDEVEALLDRAERVS